VTTLPSAVETSSTGLVFFGKRQLSRSQLRCSVALTR
jgi:hypothetical protein